MARVDHVVVVVGPTGVGKSDLAIALAQELRGEVISTDAYQLYRDMDIGTAKTPEVDRRGVPHHLVDVLDLAQSASVAQFQTAARGAVDDCRTRGVVPVVVGGSSLYVRAVLDDLDFPGTDPAVRARWARRLEELGAPALHRELAQRDPAAAAQILPSNGRRIVRALEVVELDRRRQPCPGLHETQRELSQPTPKLVAVDCGSVAAERTPVELWTHELEEFVSPMRLIGGRRTDEVPGERGD